VADLSFLQRFSLGWRSLLRSLSDAEYAERLGGIDEPPAALPEPPLEEPSPEPPPARVSGPGTAEGALQLLNLLQREGRLVDFLQQEVASFSDAQIGQAARVVHEGCRKTLKRYIEVEPVLEAGEGEPTTVGDGFDQEAIKLVGNVAGGAPFRGVLRHKGWRAKAIHLPETLGEHDFRILAPAEVEL